MKHYFSCFPCCTSSRPKFAFVDFTGKKTPLAFTISLGFLLFSALGEFCWLLLLCRLFSTARDFWERSYWSHKDALFYWHSMSSDLCRLRLVGLIPGFYSSTSLHERIVISGEELRSASGWSFIVGLQRGHSVRLDSSAFVDLKLGSPALWSAWPVSDGVVVLGVFVFVFLHEWFSHFKLCWMFYLSLVFDTIEFYTSSSAGCFCLCFLIRMIFILLINVEVALVVAFAFCFGLVDRWLCFLENRKAEVRVCWVLDQTRQYPSPITNTHHPKTEYGSLTAGVKIHPYIKKIPFVQNASISENCSSWTQEKMITNLTARIQSTRVQT